MVGPKKQDFWPKNQHSYLPVLPIGLKNVICNPILLDCVSIKNISFYKSSFFGKIIPQIPYFRE